jgi:hypothetical protein
MKPGQFSMEIPGQISAEIDKKKPTALIEFGPAGSRSRGLVRGGALADGERWPIKKGHHRFVALAIWRPGKRDPGSRSHFAVRNAA